MAIAGSRRRFTVPVLVAMLAALGLAFATLRACHGGRKLVEVFDNGPVGGPPGASEGYIWVDSDALPPPGKAWKPTDPNSLSDEDRERIR